MSNLFSTLHISGTALNVNQSAINIVSNNIANMNTEGYHKQKVNLAAVTVGLPVGNNVNSQINTNAGVEIISIERYSTNFLNSYYNDQISEQSYLNEQKNTMTNIANVFDDLEGQGLDTALQAFYEAINNFSKSPNDLNARRAFIEAASALAKSMNKIAKKMNDTEESNVGDGTNQHSLNHSKIKTTADSLNRSLDELASVNKMLANSQTGTLENNTLLDKRDLILKEISQYGDFKTEIQSDGSVKLSLGGIKVVSGEGVEGYFGVQTGLKYDEFCQNNGIKNTNESNAVITLEKDGEILYQNLNEKFDTGLIGGILDSENSYESIRADLNNLAQEIADTFNEIQTREGAYYIETNNGNIQLSNENIEDYKIFITNDSSSNITAENISINQVFQEENGAEKLAAAYFPNNNPDINAVGNSNNITEMLNTRNQSDSIEKTYDEILGKITAAYESKTNESAMQDSVVQTLDNKINEQTGVNLNEELTDLIKFQNAFTASARVFSVCNNVLDTLVHLGE